ncbi:hypothetical protein E2562_020752 [Oryza meyeriana var. granulata]|uniref:Uncharacterized protein n=1 Tax=Oryza meyeriana var. granulata TaxID=110450 RepID=A0A6G1CHD9_9ORYZ|nr:hypothetical protein E2562_020752 [Oryza meyeriana var. granulata]
MVKAVVGDEAQLKALEGTLSSSSAPPPAQVGLIVGKLSASSDRVLAYSLIPTPPTDAGDPACFLRAASAGAKAKAKPKGGGKGAGAASSDAAPSLDFDADWVAEHARQVSRMLLGGMSVIGIYIWASEASFKATSPSVLSQVVRAVSQVAPLYGSGVDERLLIHISYSPRRWAYRICDMSSGSLRPCDFKYSKLLASLQTFRCTYNFEIRLPIVQAEPFKKVISKAISHLTKEVQNAKALIDGVLFSDDMDNTLEGPHNVEFLVPFKDNLPAEECSLEGVSGLLLFAGSVSALAYLGPKESISEAISDLKLETTNSTIESDYQGSGHAFSGETREQALRLEFHHWIGNFNNLILEEFTEIREKNPFIYNMHYRWLSWVDCNVAICSKLWSFMATEILILRYLALQYYF